MSTSPPPSELPLSKEETEERGVFKGRRGRDVVSTGYFGPDVGLPLLSNTLDQYIVFVESELKKELDGQVDKIRFWREGGTSILYSGEIEVTRADGTTKTYEKLFKVDKPPRFLARSTAWRHVNRGYSLAHEFATLQELIGMPGISHPESIIKLPGVGKGVVAKMEHKYPGCTLEEMVEERGPLDYTTHARVFKKILTTGERLLRKKGMLHRDLKPSNILIDQETLDTWLIDFGNAAKKDDLEEKVSPTAGGHFIMDPITVAGFTEDTPQYTQQSESYGITVDAYYARTGKKLFEYDYATWAELAAVGITPAQALETGYWNYHDEKGVRRGINHKGESLLDEQGNLSIAAHERTLDEGLKELLGEDERFRDWYRRGLTVKKEERWSSIKEQKEEFERLTKPTRWERLKGKTKRLIVGSALVGAAAIAGLGLYAQNCYHEWNTARAVAEASKTVVASTWDAGHLVASSNILDLEVTTYVTGDSGNQFRYPGQLKGPEVIPGDELNLFILLKKVEDYPEEMSSGFEYKVYFEGREPLEASEHQKRLNTRTPFTIYAKPFNTSVPSETLRFTGSGWETERVMVPEDMEPGVHPLIVEVYTPINRDANGNEYETVTLPPLGSGLERLTIPVTVTGAENPAFMYKIGFEDSNFIAWTNPLQGSWSSPNETRTDVIVPELHYSTLDDPDEACDGNARADLPTNLPIMNGTFIGVTRENGTVTGCSVYPVKKRLTGWYEDPAQDHYIWRLGPFDSEFHKTVKRYCDKVRDGSLFEKAARWKTK